MMSTLSRTRRDPRSGGWRIALVCDWFLPRLGGIERHLAGLAAGLGRAGHDVTVITPMPNAPAAVEGARIRRLPAWLLPGAGLVWTPSAFRRLGAMLESGGYDVVHVHTSIVSPAAFAAIRHAQRAGLPTIATGHSILDGFSRAFRALDAAAHWSGWPVAYSAVSERVARGVRPLIAPHPVDILPNAVDAAAWRVAHRPPADVVVIACVMRLVPRKRGEALLQALRTAVSRLPAGIHVRLEIAGDGPERGRLERLARRLELDGCVRFWGALTPPEVKSLLARSHFFVLPSLLEAFGIAALEARAAALPVVAMRESGVAEFITHGLDGLLAGDDAEFADCILRLCADPRLRVELTAHNARTPVAFTWDRTLSAHFAVYERARLLAALRPAGRPLPEVAARGTARTGNAIPR